MTEAPPLLAPLAKRSPEEHRRLVLRALRIDEQVLDDVRAAFQPQAAGVVSLPRRLAILARVFRAHNPHHAPLPPGPEGPCPVGCGGVMAPFLARRLGDGVLVLGRCGRCRHGALLSGGAKIPPEGALDEPAREWLLPWISEACDLGSGALLYAGGGAVVPGSSEHKAPPGAPGGLAEALASGAIPAKAHDGVIFQSLLERAPDPVLELIAARKALRPGGFVVVVVPSAEAAEFGVFRSAYRALRSDHLHLFSRASLLTTMSRAGISLEFTKSTCELHLLRDFLSPQHLASIYTSGRGPDLIAVGRAIL